MQQKSPIDKLSQYHLALILQFIHGAQIISNISRVSKTFNAIIKKDLIWRNQCHSIFNFTRRRAQLNQTWYECFLRKCKASIGAKTGKPNESFAMTPLRGHKAFITANTILQDLVISGDNQGTVRAWLLDPSDYQDSDPAELVIYKFKPWDQNLVNGEVIKHDYTRVDRVWILDSFDDDDDGFYEGDGNESISTIVAVSGNQVCILRIGIEGFVPPKFVQDDDDNDDEGQGQYVKKLIQITEIKQISQIEIIKRKIKIQDSDNQNSSYTIENVLAIAPNCGYSSANDISLVPQTQLLLIDLKTGQKLESINLAQGLTHLQHKRIQNNNQPFGLPLFFNPNIRAVHQTFLRNFDQIDKRFKQLLKLNNREELCYCLNNGLVQKINLKTLKIIHQDDTKIMRGDEQVVILCMGQDAAGSYIYALSHCKADNVYELTILSQNTLKILSRVQLDNIGIANIKSSYFRIEVCKFEMDDITKGQFQTGFEVHDNGNLVVLLLGGVYFQCYLHTTQSFQQEEEDQEQEEKKEKVYIEGDLSHKLTQIKKEKKNPKDYHRNLYNIEELAQYGTVFDFHVFKRKNIVTAHSQDILKVSNIRTGEEIFVLRGGSKISHPKSYVKNPERNGFSYSMISGDKILGVRGNLVRVFSFDV